MRILEMVDFNLAYKHVECDFSCCRLRMLFQNSKPYTQ